MPEPFDPPSRDPFRDALTRAVSAPRAEGEADGDWSGVVRGIRRRRTRMLAARVVAPSVCALLVVGGVWAFSSRTDDRPAVDRPGLGSAPPTDATTVSQAQTTGVPATSTTLATHGPSTSETSTPATSLVPTSTPEISTTTSPSLVVPDQGRTVPLDLDLTAGFVTSSDDVQAFVWSLADGRGLALQPSALTTTPIAAIPRDVLTSMCNSDGMVWTGSHVFVASTTAFAEYDPASNSWSSGTLPAPRYCSRKRLTVWTGSQVMLLGGSTAPFGDPNFAPIAEAWMFDPLARQWSMSPPAPSNRDGDMSAAYVNGVVVLAGDGVPLDQTQPFLVYHPASNDWTEVAPPGPLTYTPYVTTYADQLLAIGLDNSASALTDPVSPNWRSFGPAAPTDGGRHQTAFVTKGSLLAYLHGGSSSTASMFDGASWFGSQLLDLPPSWGSQAVTLAGDFLVVAGESTASAATRTPEAFVVRLDALTGSLEGD